MPIQKSKPPQKGVFVIMPYVNTPSRNEEQLNSYFENHIKRSIEQASLKHEYRVWRSGETFNITDEIIRDLFEADIVIADLSGILPNPNVMYELGVRLALSEKPVILIREKHPDNKRVFDVDSYYVYPYDPLDYSQLENHLIGKLKRLESGEERFESPVKKIIQNELILSSSFSSLRLEEQREILLRGVKIVSDKIAPAFGPQGVGVSVMNEKGEDLFTTNGFEIATAAWSPNPLERRGISLLVSLAKAQKSIAGDGTKTAMILACGMMESAQEAMKKGWMPKDLASGMQKAVDNTIEFLRKSTDTKLNRLRFLQIATTAAKDNIIAEILVDLLDKVGKDGHISFQTGTQKKTS